MQNYGILLIMGSAGFISSTVLCFGVLEDSDCQLPRLLADDVYC